MDGRKAYEDIRGKKERGRGGGAARSSTRIVPHHLCSSQSDFLLVEVPAAPSDPKSLKRECTWTPLILAVILSRREWQ